MLAGEKRTHTYISDWDKVTYVDDDVKITQPVNGKSFMMMKTTKGNDEPLNNDEQKIMLQKKQSALVQLVQDLGKFFISQIRFVHYNPYLLLTLVLGKKIVLVME